MSAILVVELFIGREGKIIQYLIGFHGRIQIIIKVQIAEILTYNGQKYELIQNLWNHIFMNIPLNAPVVLILFVRLAGEAM